MRHFATRKNRQPLRWSLAFLLGCGLYLGSSAAIRAQAAKTVPVEIKTLIEQIDKVANQRDLPALMKFYSPQFTSADGLTYESLQKALSQLWQRYPDLQYQTKIESWQQEGDKLSLDTVTEITGTGKVQSMDVKLQSTVKSRQQFQGKQLLRQEILSEETQITSGSNPPTVEVRLPEKVRVGQEFDFDVIVKEPLGNDLLLGTAIAEKIEGDRYLTPGNLDLEILEAGGLFKRIKAPNNPEERWLSAIVIRGDGAILITRRLIVEN
jgi:ketosteroid isomerase-like protein